MLSALRDMLPFAIAGAFLPTWTLMVIALLATDRPVGNATAFIAGNAAFRLALGVVALWAGTALQLRPPQLSPGPRAALYAAVAVGAFALAIVQWRRKRTDEPPRWVERFERISPTTTFLLSAAFVASPGIQWVYFLAGIDALAAAQLPWWQSLMMVAVFVTLLETMLMAPLAIYLLLPSASEQFLGSLRNVLSTEGSRVSAVILLIVAVVCATRAVEALA